MDRERQIIRLALDNDRLVDRRLLERAGVSPDAWRRHLVHGCWVEAAPGVWRHVATEATWRLRARAAMRWMGAEAALFGPSAIAWWELEPPHAADDVHVVADRTARGRRGPVVIHTVERWNPKDHRRVDGVKVQEPARAVLAAAASGWNAARLEKALDEAVRRRLVSQNSIESVVRRAEGSGHAGVRTLRTLMLDTGGESYLERRFLRLVRQAGLPRPQCQVVHRSHGAQIARVDFLFPGTDVVVEVTGRLGHVSDAERRADARRRNALQRAGRVVLEFTTVDVLDERRYVLSTLRDWLRPELPFA